MDHKLDIVLGTAQVEPKTFQEKSSVKTLNNYQI